MKFTEIRDLTVEELRKRDKQLRDSYFELKMKHSLGQLSNPLEIRYTRRDISKVKTALTAKLAR